MPTTYDRSGLKIIFLVGLMISLLVLLSSLPRIPFGMPTSQEVPTLPTLSPHALRHESAKLAWETVRTKGLFCKWSCNDGRDRYVCPIRGTNLWAIVVTELGHLRTAFTADQAYAVSVTEGCRNPWKLQHN